MSELNLSDSLTTYEEKPIFGDSFFLTDIRQIQYPKLVPYTLEAKYPQLVGRLNENEMINNVLTLVAAEPFNPQEAIKIIESSPSLFGEQITSKNSHQEAVKKIYEQHEIDYLDLALQVDKALLEAVEDLSISDAQKNNIKEKLTASEIEFGFLGRGSGAHSNGLRTYVDLSFPVYQAYSLSNLLNVPMTTDLIKTMLVGNIAHERGHIVDFCGKSVTPFGDAYSNFIEDTDPKFPIKIIESPENIKSMLFYERTAMYFEYQVIKKLGLSVEAIEDYQRYTISMMMRFFDRVPPLKLTQFVSETKNIPQDMQNSRIVAGIFTKILSGHPIAQSFPFMKEDIEKGISKAEENSIQF